MWDLGLVLCINNKFCENPRLLTCVSEVLPGTGRN